MKDFNWLMNETGLCPVPPDTLVVYRTTHPDNLLSHVHAPVPARMLRLGNGGDPKTMPKIGRIFDYALV